MATTVAYHGFPLGSNGNILVSNSGSATWGSLDISANQQYQDLLKRVDELEKRLCVLHPNGQLHEKYPALKESYEAHKIIEKLVGIDE